MKILIVDDGPLNLKLLRAELEGDGHAVRDAFDGVEALDLLKREPFDAIVSDILMPRMDGYRLCQKVRQSPRLHDIPFIFFTATYLSPDDEKLCMDLGADRYLRKSATAEEILAALYDVTTNEATRKPRSSRLPPEAVVMKEYNARLVAKLEQKNIQLRLQSAAVETAANAIAITDPKGNIVYSNPAFTALTGYTMDEAAGQNLRLLKSGQHDAQFYRELWRTISSGQIWRGELVNRRKDGSLYHTEQTITPVRADGGAITHFIGIMHDVTARKRAEEELSTAHGQLQQLFDHSPAVLYALKLEGEKVAPYMVSENMTRLLGFTVAETLSFGWWAGQLHPEDRAGAIASIGETIAQGTSRTEYRLRHKGGEYRWVDDHRRLVRDAAGAPAELVGVWTDITERKNAEERLRKSEEMFRELTENIQEVFWMTDPEMSQVLYVSPRYEKIWGQSCASLLANPRQWLDCIAPEDRERVRRTVDSGLSSAEYQETFRIIRPDGTARWIRDRAFPIRDAADKIVRLAGISEDITDYRQLEEQFRHAQKMEAIGTLAGGIAHDFNNILGAIMGYAELSKRRVKDDPTLTEFLEAQLQGAQRAAALVRQILSFSRIQEQQRTLVQLRHVVTEPLQLLRATIPSTIEFNVTLGTDLPTVLADPTQIHQVVMNLCTNAAHAMKNRPGRLEVRLERFTVDEPQARTNPSLHPGPYVRLTVSDTGHGMDQATKDRIFEPFFTTKAPGEGTGLGLSVVHGIMKAHDGAITVYSQPGEGTVFHLYFPAQETAANKLDSLPATVPMGHGETVLYVDDEKPLTLLARAMLEELGYVAVTLTSSVEALSLVRSEPAKFALVITDLTMPMLTGADLAVQLLAIRPDLPVILTTGYTASLTAEMVKTLGVRELLLKPHSLQSLGVAVHRALAKPIPH